MGERLGTLKYRRSRWTQASAADDNVCFSSTSIPMAWTLSLRPDHAGVADSRSHVLRRPCLI
jgi:hypothetical protein